MCRTRAADPADILAPIMPTLVPGMPKGTGPITSVRLDHVDCANDRAEEAVHEIDDAPTHQHGLNMRDIMNFMTTKYQAKEA